MLATKNHFTYTEYFHILVRPILSSAAAQFALQRNSSRIALVGATTGKGNPREKLMMLQYA